MGRLEPKEAVKTGEGGLGGREAGWRRERGRKLAREEIAGGRKAGMTE